MTGLSAIQSELDRAAGDKPKRASRPRKGFAAHLERIEEVIEPDIPDDCVGLEKVLIGEDRSERLDVVPPKFRVIVTRRPKYAFRGCDGEIQALAPAHIIESGLPSERLLAISLSPNTPTVCRFIGRRRFTCVTASRSADR